ncbi:MAG TPA: hypothetical protein VK972_08605 [Wenzhouxiangella sp.]|nr:hypothetical protein [Wenzhouxiangella sp.]
MNPSRYFKPTDLHGLAQLAGDGVAGTSRLIERLHVTIARASMPAGRAVTAPARGMTGLVYRSVRGVNALVGASIQAVAKPVVARIPGQGSSAAREQWRAALNGVLGDHLAGSGNPLTIPMRFRKHGAALTLERSALAGTFDAPRGRLLVAVHGLCMNDLQWGARGIPHRLGAALGFTPLYLHYNSGLPIADNGRALAGLLQELVDAWPVPVEEIVMVGHSMGGLVARSAQAHAARGRHGWEKSLTGMVFLGTPHHGSPLERVGHGFNRLLGISPYSAPFCSLGGLRSAGIRDLRHGLAETSRPASPTTWYAIAATAGTRAGRLAGDGLVPVDSALGRHPDPRRALGIPQENCRLVPAAGHLGLLRHPEVYRSLRRWLR